jgi:hypothetical protein
LVKFSATARKCGGFFLNFCLAVQSSWIITAQRTVCFMLGTNSANKSAPPHDKKLSQRKYRWRYHKNEQQRVPDSLGQRTLEDLPGCESAT